MRSVYVGGDEKEKRKCGECFLLLFFDFSIPFHMTEYVFIFTNCNINAISPLIVMNNIRKKLVMIAAHYDNQIVANHNTISIIISNINIDSNN